MSLTRIDFAQIYWLNNLEGLAWSANCGAQSDRAYALRTLELAAQSLQDHFQTCPNCQDFLGTMQG
jgi:hypothetical protein